MPLTDAKVRNLKYVPAGKNKHPDFGGLLIDVRPTMKVWRWRYRIAGKENVLTIGRFPDYSLEEARQKRDEARRLLGRGGNPAIEKKAQKVRSQFEDASTFKAVYHEWLASRDWMPSTRRNRLSQMELHVLPYLGPLPVKEITPMMVLEVLRRSERPGKSTKIAGKGARTRDTGSAAVARRLRQYLAGVFNVAIATGRCESNPAGSLREVLTPARKMEHKIPLTPAQVGELMRTIDKFGGEVRTKIAYKLMWWTLLRPGEVVGAHWDELDLDAGKWTIPRARMKNRKSKFGDHVIGLPRQAIAELKRWKDFTGGIGYVFPHRDNDDAPMVSSSLRQAFMRMKLGFKYSPHATRTTASTKLNEIGYRYDVIERQLDHEDRDAIRRAYNRADYLEERTAMLQQWADLLDAWKAGAQVLPLMSKAAA